MFKFIATLLGIAVTSALTTLAYKVYKPSERANRIAERILKFLGVLIVIAVIFALVYSILVDLGYREPIRPLFPKQ